jgi:hypothetical protein
MKMYVLLSLIGLIVGLSYLPLRVKVKEAGAAPHDSLPA